MTTLFLLIVLLLPIVGVAVALIAVPRWTWGDEAVPMPRSLLIGLAVGLFAPYFPTTAGGLLRLIGIGLVARPSIRAIFKDEPPSDDPPA